MEMFAINIYNKEKHVSSVDMNTEIIMYQTEGCLTKIETTFDNDAVWLSIDQMEELFQRDKFTIS